jgi:hypothetical protein
VVLGEQDRPLVAELPRDDLGTQSFSLSQIGIAFENEGSDFGKVAR